MMSQQHMFDLVQRQKWSTITVRCSTHPNEIPLQDENGFTVLHWACCNRPPLRVIRALLHHDPSSNGAGVCTMKDNDGIIPLAYAISCMACIAVMKELIRFVPKSAGCRDLRGWTPLHYLCSEFFSESSDGTSFRDQIDILSVVRLLLREDPTLSNLGDGICGNTPLSILCERMERYGRPTTTTTVGSSSLNQDHYSDRGSLGLTWDMMQIISKAAYRGHSSKPQKWRFVHAVAGIPFCPMMVVKAALKNHPEQVKEIDEHNGNLPLHIIASSNSPLLSSSSNNNDVVIIDLFLDAYPMGASKRNHDGKLPFDLAIQSGRTWNNGLKSILDAYPPAVISHGLDDRFYPRLFESLGCSLEEDVPNATFEILKEKPDLFANAAINASIH